MVLCACPRHEKKRWRRIGEQEKIRKEQDLRNRYSTLPAHIFRDRNLAPLESISEYLKEVQGLSFHEIAFRLGRDDRTIWTCYDRAKKKRTVKRNNKGG